MNKIKDSFNNERKRYSFKGLHLLISIGQTFIFFYYIPNVLNYLWIRIIPLASWKTIFSVLTLIVPIILFCIINGVYSLIYYIKHPFFEQYRIQSQPWPWERPRQEYKQWRDRLIYYAFMNMIVCNIFILILQHYTSGVEHYNHSTTILPSKFDHLWQIVFFMICDDCIFYFTHRLFHSNKYLYSFHKIHHEHHVSTSFSNLQTHIIDYLFSNVVAVVSGFHILGQTSHYITYLLWNIWRIMETCDGHCGYEFPWSMFRLLPYSGSSEYHNFHHSNNTGNYSSFFTYWDTLFNTNQDYYQHQSLQQTKEQQQQTLLHKKFDVNHDDGDNNNKKTSCSSSSSSDTTIF